MSTSRNDDPNKPATGYPYSPPQSGYPPNGYTSMQGEYYQQHGVSATGLPYTVAPPTSYYTTQPYPTQTYDPRRATLFRRIIIAMIAIFIIFGAITFIIWLVLRPKLPEIRVESASVNGLNASSSQLTGNWDVVFFVRNPNKKMNIHYDRVEGSVLYRSEFVTETGLEPFAQGTQNETTIEAKFAASSTYLGEGFIKQISEERNRGTVNFNVRLLAWVRFRSTSWRTRLHMMTVYCDDVTIRFSNSAAGALTGGPKKCDVDLAA